MYRPHSLYSDIGDVEILEHKGKLHMFHLVIPNRDLIAHCVSDDGLVWRELPAALSTGDPGTPDDDMIRTVSITPCGDRFYMLYASCARREGGRVERVCTAVSRDLNTWEKIPEASGIEAGEAFYETQRAPSDMVNWRDPKPYYENGVYYCVLCARNREGRLLRRGCVALMTSRDMIHWEYQKPLFLPGAYYTVECPQIYRIGKRYYLIGSIMEDSSQRYWVADNLYGPYRVAGGENLLMPPGSHYAGRLAQFHGRDVFLCWTFAKEDGPSPFGLQVHPDAVIKYIPALLEAETDEEGRLLFRSAPAWECFAKHEAPVSPECFDNTVCLNPIARRDENSFVSESGMEMWLSRKKCRSFRIKCTLKIQGYCGGLAFHATDDGGAYQLEFYPHEQRVRLVSHFGRRRTDGVAWFDHRVIQTAHNDFASGEVEILLLAVGGEIEISLNGRVRMATVSTASTEGHWGVLADGACVQIEKLSMAEMLVPNTEEWVNGGSKTC